MIAMFFIMALLSADSLVPVWTLNYGGENSEAANTFCKSAGNGFVLAGYTYSFDAEKSDAYFVKTDAQGDMEWTSQIDCGGWESINAISLGLDESGYIAVGHTTANQSFDLLILKLDENGNELWRKIYGGDGFDTAEALCKTDSGYMICGTTSSFGYGEDDIYLVNIDSSGDTLWTKTYGSTKSDLGRSIIPTSDGNFLITGATGLYDAPGTTTGHNREIDVIKINPDGEILLENTFWIMSTHQNSYDEGFDICESVRGGYIIAGSTSKHAGELMDACVVKIDEDLALEWKKVFEFENFYDYGYALAESPTTKHIFLTGTCENKSTNTFNAFSVCMDSLGHEVARKVNEDDNSQSGRDIILGENGEVFIAGYTSSSGSNGGKDFLMLKLNAELAIDNDFTDKKALLAGVRNYPNPFNPNTTITFELEKDSTLNIDIFNVKGEKIKALFRGKLEKGSQNITWNGKDDNNKQVSSGIYFYKIKADEECFVRKALMVK